MKAHLPEDIEQCHFTGSRSHPLQRRLRRPPSAAIIVFASDRCGDRHAFAWKDATIDTRHEWTTSGAYKVAPGVHRIPLPLPQDALRAVNVYAIEAGDELVLIDAGLAHDAARQRLDEALAALGCTMRDVARFLVTHIHKDHYTQAIALRREFGTRVSLGIGEWPSLNVMGAHRTERLRPQLAQLHQAGAKRVIDALLQMGRTPSGTRNWQLPDDWLIGHTTVVVDGRELVVIPTPGHTQGHLVFADMNADLMFAGDHVLPHITPSIGFEAAPGELPLRDYLGSLARVRHLPDMQLLPAHGPPTDSVHRRVDELLAHHDTRLDACQAAVQSGAGTGFETARALRWTRRERPFDDLDVFNQMLATTETLAHLELLDAQGRITRSVVDGTHHYEPLRNVRK